MTLRDIIAIRLPELLPNMDDADKQAIVSIHGNSITPVNIDDLLNTELFIEMLPYLSTLNRIDRVESVYHRIADAVQSTFDMRTIDIKSMDRWLSLLKQQVDLNERIRTSGEREWNKLSKHNKSLIAKMEGKPVDLIQSLQMFGALYESDEEADADANNKKEFLPILCAKLAFRYSIHTERFTMTYTPNAWYEAYRITLGWLHHQMSRKWASVKDKRQEQASQRRWDASMAKDCFRTARQCIEEMQKEFDVFKGEYEQEMALPLHDDHVHQSVVVRLDGFAAGNLIMDGLNRCLHTDCDGARELVAGGVDMMLEFLDIKWKRYVMKEELRWRTIDSLYCYCEYEMERRSDSLMNATQYLYKHKDEQSVVPVMQITGILAIGMLIEQHEKWEKALDDFAKSKSLQSGLPYLSLVIDDVTSVCESFGLKECMQKMQSFKERMNNDVKSVDNRPSETYKHTACPICGAEYECQIEYYFQTTRCATCNAKMYILPGLSMWYDMIYSGVQYITTHREEILTRIATQKPDWWNAVGLLAENKELRIMTNIMGEMRYTMPLTKQLEATFPLMAPRNISNHYMCDIDSPQKWNIKQWETVRQTLNI